MNFHVLKKFLCLIIPLFIIFCAVYSFGIFDGFFIKNVSEKNYELGDFTYTGKLKDGKFIEIGEIHLNNGAKYTGNFKDGRVNGTFLYDNGGNCILDGTFKNGVFLDGKLITDENKILRIWRNGKQVN